MKKTLASYWKDEKFQPTVEQKGKTLASYWEAEEYQPGGKSNASNMAGDYNPAFQRYGLNLTDAAIDSIKKAYSATFNDKYDLNVDQLRLTSGFMPTSFDKQYADTELDRALYSAGLPSAKNISKYIEDYNATLRPQQQYAALYQEVAKNADKYLSKGDDGRIVVDEIALAEDLADILDRAEYADLNNSSFYGSTSEPKTKDDFLSNPAGWLSYLQKSENKDPNAYTFGRLVTDLSNAGTRALRAEQTEQRREARQAERKEKMSTWAFDKATEEAGGDEVEAAIKVIGENIQYDELTGRYTPESVGAARDALSAIGFEQRVQDLAFSSMGIDKEPGQRTAAQKAEEEKRANLSAALEASVDMSLRKRDTIVFGGGAEEIYSDELQSQVDAFREAQLAKGYTNLDVDNVLRENGMREYINSDTVRNYAIDVLTDIGMEAPEAATYYDNLSQEEKEVYKADMAFDNRVHESFGNELGRSIVSIPARAAIGIVNSAFSAAEMASPGLANLATEVERLEETTGEKVFKLQETLNEWQYKMQQYGTSENHAVLNVISDVGSELLRMYAVNAAGCLVASGSVTGAAASAVSAAEKGTGVFLNYARKAFSAQSIPFIVSSMGGYYSQALNQGATRGQAAGFALVAGAAEGALESLGADAIFQRTLGKGFAQQGIQGGKGLMSKYGMQAIDLFSAALGNGIEEGASYVISGIAERAFYNPEWQGDWGEFWENVGMGALIGFIGSVATMPESSRSYRYLQDMLENGYTEKGMDAMMSAKTAETMPKAQYEARIQQAMEMTPDEYRLAKNEEYQHAQVIENAQKKRDTQIEDNNIKVREAKSKVTSLKNRLDKVNKANGKDKNKNIRKLTLELEDAKSALAKLQEDVKAKNAQAESEYQSATAKHNTELAVVQRRLKDHDIAADLRNQLEEARAEYTSAQANIDRFDTDYVQLMEAVQHNPDNEALGYQLDDLVEWNREETVRRDKAVDLVNDLSKKNVALRQEWQNDTEWQEALRRHAEELATRQNRIAAGEIPNVGLDAFGGEIQYKLDKDTIASMKQKYITPDVQAQLDRMNAVGDTWNDQSPEREQFRKNKADEYYDTFQAKNKDRVAVIIIGPPAAGKSTIADPIVEQIGALLLDSDIVKMGDAKTGFQGIPEYGDGEGVSAVNDESGDIIDRVFEKALENGDNIVYAKVGGKTKGIREIALDLKNAGYTTRLILNELPIQKAMQRNIGRFQHTGRLVPPEYLLGVGNQPVRTYMELKEEGIFDDYERYSNDVPRGIPPVRVDASGTHKDGQASMGILPGRERGSVSGSGVDRGLAFRAGTEASSGGSPTKTGAAGTTETITSEASTPQQDGNMQSNIPDLGAQTAGDIRTGTSRVHSNTYQHVFSEAERQMADMRDEDFAYGRNTEKRSIEEAQTRLDQQGVDECVKNLRERSGWDGVDLDTAMGVLAAYKEEAAQTGDYSKVMDMAMLIQQHVTQSAQAVQSLAKYSRTSTGMVQQAANNVAQAEKNAPPKVKQQIETEVNALQQAIASGEGIEQAVESSMRKKPKNVKQAMIDELYAMAASGSVDASRLRDIVKEANGLPILTQSEIKDIIENLDKADQQTSERERRRYEYMAAQIVADKAAVSSREKVRAFKRIMMLLNPRTVSKNAVANVPMGLLENLKDVPGTLVDKLVSLKTGERTTTFASGEKYTAQLKGLGRGTKYAVLDMKQDVDTSGMPGRYENVRANAFKNKALNSLSKLTGGLMQLGDRGFYAAAFDGRLAEMRALGLDTESSTAIEQAHLYALDRVFQNNSKLAARLSGVRNNLGVFGEMLFPFVQTPANIADKLMDYTPGGLVRAIVQLGKAHKTGEFNQKLFVDRMGRSLTGTGIIALGATLAAKGLLKDDEGENAKERAMHENAGVEGYSLVLGDTTYTIDWANPVGNLFLMGAAAHNIGVSLPTLMEEGRFLEAISGMAITSVNAFFNNTFLQNAANLLYSDTPGEAIWDVIFGSSSQFTPSAVAAIARITDGYERQTYDPNWAKEFLNGLMVRIPGLRQMVPKKIATDGTEIQSGNAGERLLENLISPGNFSTATDDRVNAEIYRLHSEGNQTDQILPVAEKKLKGYELSADEYNEYQRELGTACYNAALRVINGSGYVKATDKEKSEAIRKAIRNATENIRDKWKDKLGLK